MTKKSVLVICPNDLDRAPRFITTIRALEKDYAIIVAGNYKPQDKSYEYIQLPGDEFEWFEITFHYNFPKLIRKVFSFFILRLLSFLRKNTTLLYNFKITFDWWYWSIVRKEQLAALINLNFDIVIVHHLKYLPLAIKLAESKMVNLILNAHEYYPLEYENNKAWMKKDGKYYHAACKFYLNKVSKMFVVCESIKNKYEKEYKFKEGIVINNSKEYYELSPKQIGSKIKLIHHGGADNSRKIDVMIDVAQYLSSDYELHFVFLEYESDHAKYLVNYAKKYTNVFFHPPVSFSDIPVFLNSFDMGLYILPPTNYNNSVALPNKFFEFIQARLCLAFAPGVETSRLIEQYKLGVISNDYTAKTMAESILELSKEEIYSYKSNSDKAARILNVEIERKKIYETVSKLIN